LTGIIAGLFASLGIIKQTFGIRYLVIAGGGAGGVSGGPTGGGGGAGG